MDYGLHQFARCPNLKNGVEIYGGFAATETMRSQRNYTTNVTVLSGDIDQNDTTDSEGVVTDTANIAGSNAYQVFNNANVNSSVILDGFTITAGKANQSWDGYQSRRGGMFNDASSPSLNNVIFRGNYAYRQGGGMFNRNNSNPSLSNVTISNNFSYYGGGCTTGSAVPA